MVTSTPCARCGGSGQIIANPCPECGGEGRTVEERTYTVDIPAGVDTGSTLRLSGRGAAGPRGGAPGDLYVHLRVADDPRFERDGVDLHSTAAPAVHPGHAGHHDRVRDPRRHRGHRRPPGARRRARPSGSGAGACPTSSGASRGDLLIDVVVDVPTDLSEEEEEVVRQLAELRGEPVAPSASGLISKLRSAFK